jgi:predicted chitinase
MGNNALPVWDTNAFSSYSSVLNTFISYGQQLMYEQTGSATTSTGFIPINISLTMAGLSGMKIYQEFTVDTNYLPSNYNREMVFIIKGVNHTIENNMWNTTIDSLSLPKTTNKPTRFLLNDVINDASGITTNEGDPIPESYRDIVEKIIQTSLSYGITDKSQLTAILTVAQAEAGLVPNKVENLRYNANTPEGLARIKSIFKTKTKGKTDQQIRNIFSNPESTANFVYSGGSNDEVGDGYKYRGRGLTQITSKGNYKKIQNLLIVEGARINIVNNPDSVLDENLSIRILVLGKYKGIFGNELDKDIDYTNNATAITKTQNRGASSAIILDYQRALNSINRTAWIQELLK